MFPCQEAKVEQAFVIPYISVFASEWAKVH